MPVAVLILILKRVDDAAVLYILRHSALAGRDGDRVTNFQKDFARRRLLVSWPKRHLAAAKVCCRVDGLEKTLGEEPPVADLESGFVGGARAQRVVRAVLLVFETPVECSLFAIVSLDGVAGVTRVDDKENVIDLQLASLHNVLVEPLVLYDPTVALMMLLAGPVVADESRVLFVPIVPVTVPCDKDDQVDFFAHAARDRRPFSESPNFFSVQGPFRVSKRVQNVFVRSVSVEQRGYVSIPVVLPPQHLFDFFRIIHAAKQRPVPFSIGGHMLVRIVLVNGNVDRQLFTFARV